MRKFYIVFFLVNLLLSFWYIDTWNNANTTSRALPVVAFFEEGHFRIDKYHEMTMDKAHIDGHYYTDKPPLPSMLVLPFYGILKELDVIKPPGDGNPGKGIYILGSFLCGSLVFSLILLMAFIRISRSKPSVSPVVLAMMPFYGSFVYVYSGTFYAHLLSGLFILLGYHFIRKKQYLISGLFSGLAFLSEYTVALFFPVWAIQIWIQERSFFKGFLFGAGTIPSIIFIAFYNYVFTGSAFEMLYKYDMYSFLHENYGFVLPSLLSFWGLTFSNFKGIFFYVPFLILALTIIFKNIPLKKFRSHYLTYISVLFFVFIASYQAWWGGWTYGPRLLFPLAVLLLYEGIYQLSKFPFSRIAFWILTVFGLAGAVLAKLTVVYSIPSESINPFLDTIFPNLVSGHFNPNNLATMIFGLNPLLAGLLWVLLFGFSVIGLSWYFRTVKAGG